MIIIDGHNLLHARLLPLKADGSHQLDHLARLVHSSPRLRPQNTILVFDGDKPVAFRFGNTERLKVLFSGKNNSADFRIQQIIRKEKKTAHITVVSNDNEIRNTAKDLGAKTMNAQKFYSEFLAGGSKRKKAPVSTHSESGGVSRKALKEWMEIFKNRPDAENDEEF